MRKLAAVLTLLWVANPAHAFVYLYGRAGVFNGYYYTPERVYEKAIGSYMWGDPPRPPFRTYPVAGTTSELAISPAGFGLQGDAWRLAAAAVWNRHRVAGDQDRRQVDRGLLDANGDYIINTGYFAGRKLRPYFGGSVRGTLTRAQDMHNGVAAFGAGPEVGAVLDYNLNRSFMVIYFGFMYHRLAITGNKSASPVG